jgi:MFS family permease
VLCGLADSFWLLFGARAIVGIGEAALAPAAASMIGDTFPPHRRGTAFGLFFMGMVVGGPAAIAIGGLLFGAAQAGAFASWPLLGSLAPWRTVLVLIGAGGFIVPLLFLTLKEPQRREPVSHVPLSIVASRFWVERRLLLPILLGVALLSVGDYGLLSWVPATLSRVFGWTPEQVGPPFGLITAAAGISGALLGGVLSDFALAKGGTRARFTLCAVAAALGAVGAGLICTTTSGLVLAGLGLWTFASAVGATAGIAALQDAVPSGFRGIGMSLVAFCNTLLGLGLGPTIVALVTERGFGYPGAVGFSISLVVVPAAIVSALLLFACSRMIARARGTVAHG